MFLKLNDRVYINADKITRIKVDEVQDGIRVRFYEENTQIAKSHRFKSIDDANKWLKELLKK